MKITRYINGKKISKALSGEVVIYSDLISDTIERVNSRLKKIQADEKDINIING